MKKTLTTPRRPSGFNEYLPAEQIEFNRLLDIIRTTYEKYGYAPIDTPDLELSEVLLAKGGGETEQQIYRFERGKNDLSLRFDLTVPLARYAAEHESDLVFPFRRYHIGKVHRAERAQAGRFREFYQCDIDVIGSESTVIDAEFPAVINEIFDKFGFGEFTIRLNNRMVLNGFFEGIGLADVSAEVLRAIDKMEKLSRDDLVSALREIGLTDQQVAKVFEFTEITGTNDEVLAKLDTLGVDSPTFYEGVGKLRVLIDTLRALQVPERRFKIDLRIARGLDYYTGTVYETTLNDLPGVGSVCSGGRYDDLASNYTNTQLPGVGISIGLSRLFYKLMEAGIIQPSQQSLARVIIMPLDDGAIQRALEVASHMRALGTATIVHTEPGAMKKKFRYADRMGCRYVVVIGENELSTGVLSIKDMESGESFEGDETILEKLLSEN
ncbi:MAG: histidine--tRNA ligase [Candidatus Saccharimonas sp.]